MHSYSEKNLNKQLENNDSNILLILKTVFRSQSDLQINTFTKTEVISEKTKILLEPQMTSVG